jgi:hypothetical protein
MYYELIGVDNFKVGSSSTFTAKYTDGSKIDTTKTYTFSIITNASYASITGTTTNTCTVKAGSTYGKTITLQAKCVQTGETFTKNVLIKSLF